MDRVAAKAMVSRATAYRYFPKFESLLIEASLDGDTPDPAALFAGEPSEDPAARIDTAEAALHAMCYRNETQLRLMLAASLERKARGDAGGDIPIRQNRHTPLIEAALAPARHRFSDEAYDNLVAALALIFGTESMSVFADVLRVDEPTARRVKRWAARTLVRASLHDSAR